MKKSIALLILTLSTSLLAYGKKVIVPDENGKFSIEKEASGGIGFSWHLTGISPDNLIVFEGISSPENRGLLIGGTEEQKFNFQVLDTAKVGQTVKISFIKNFRGKYGEQSFETYVIEAPKKEKAKQVRVPEKEEMQPIAVLE